MQHNDDYSEGIPPGSIPKPGQKFVPIYQGSEHGLSATIYIAEDNQNVLYMQDNTSGNDSPSLNPVSIPVPAAELTANQLEQSIAGTKWQPLFPTNLDLVIKELQQHLGK